VLLVSQEVQIFIIYYEILGENVRCPSCLSAEPSKPLLQGVLVIVPNANYGNSAMLRKYWLIVFSVTVTVTNPFGNMFHSFICHLPSVIIRTNISI